MKRELNAGWDVAELLPGTCLHPSALPTELSWTPALVPGTAASALRAAGLWNLSQARDFDASDWWFRCRFQAAAPAHGHKTFLRLGGLATLAEVWLNAEPILKSDNMFLAHEVEVGPKLRSDNELFIRFRALGPALKERRARPRWRTRLVEQQQLRWFRTTLLGRMPGFSPGVAPVGPWRPVWLEEREAFSVERRILRTHTEGKGGVVDARFELQLWGKQLPEAAKLTVGSCEGALEVVPGLNGHCALRGPVRLPSVERWYPHTHGAQPLYPAQLSLNVAGQTHLVECGQVGFRELEVSKAEGAFGLTLNGLPIFCRGACWTTNDIVTLIGSPDSYRAALDALVDAGMNIIRLGGTMFYEAEELYALCDERGVLVWQDFMFANMDYPTEDALFMASAQLEAEQLLERLSGHVSLSVLCGSSETEQQAAMLGLPREQWSNALFSEHLPALCHERRPEVPYLPSSPSGGTLPFHPNEGVTHYYGVGAYLRPQEDARRANVRFASECLAFSNVPEDTNIERVLAPGEAPTTHPAWKSRVPRDRGVAWDFEDVRDHYLELLFGMKARALRSEDLPRYLALSRQVPGELMASTFAEWRRPGSSCRGGLVWFLRDLWPGAGFGIIDSEGHPKAPYYALKRVLAPVSLLALDEGLNGLVLHAINDRAQPLDATVRFSSYRSGDIQTGQAERTVLLPPRSTRSLSVEEMLGHFADTTYAYRFGPPPYDVGHGELMDRAQGTRLAEVFHFPHGFALCREEDVGLECTAQAAGEGSYLLTLTTRRFAQSVAITARSFRPDDNYFHLAPGEQRSVHLSPLQANAVLRGTVQPLNAVRETALALSGPSGGMP